MGAFYVKNLDWAFYGRKSVGLCAMMALRPDNIRHVSVNQLNTELNPICHLLALLGAHQILHVSSVRVKYT